MGAKNQVFCPHWGSFSCLSTIAINVAILRDSSPKVNSVVSIWERGVVRACRWVFFCAVLGSGVSSMLVLAASSYVNFEGKQTSPIRLSPDGTRLFAVNTPAARLSVFDVTLPSNPVLIAEIPVGIEPASVNPRNNDEAWVVNEVSDSISIVSVSNRMVMDTLLVKDEP